MDHPEKDPVLVEGKTYNIAPHSFTGRKPGKVVSTGKYQGVDSPGVLIFTNVKDMGKDSSEQPAADKKILFETSTFHFMPTEGGRRSKRRTGKKHGRRHKKTRKH